MPLSCKWVAKHLRSMWGVTWGFIDTFLDVETLFNIFLIASPLRLYYLPFLLVKRYGDCLKRSDSDYWNICFLILLHKNAEIVTLRSFPPWRPFPFRIIIIFFFQSTSDSLTLQNSLILTPVLYKKEIINWFF